MNISNDGDALESIVGLSAMPLRCLVVDRLIRIQLSPAESDSMVISKHYQQLR